MSISVKGPASTLVLNVPKDVVSSNLGSKDGFTFCGARVFEIATLPASTYSNFLSLEQTTGTLTLLSTDHSDIGTYEIDVRASLEDYPAVSSTVSLSVEVQAC